MALLDEITALISGENDLVFIPKSQTAKATMNEWNRIQVKQQLLRAKMKLMKRRDGPQMGKKYWKCVAQIQTVQGAHRKKVMQSVRNVCNLGGM